MNTLDSLIQGISDWMPGFAKTGYQTCAIWMDRSISTIILIPQRMQYSNNYALAVFLTANVISFLVINVFCQLFLEDRVKKAGNRAFDTFLMNGVLMGGAALVVNAAICRAASYSLSLMAYAGIMTIHIGLRVILSNLKDADDVVQTRMYH